jgi:putative oxidoreductase
MNIFRPHFSARYEHFLIMLLRCSIALIFVWFGALKVVGYNPVFDLIHYSLFPFLAQGVGLVILGVFEALIGVALLFNRAIVLTHLALLGHLLGTFTTFIFGWHVVFVPYFPVLSLDGEFVAKNLILAVAGLVVLIHETRRRKE